VKKVILSSYTFLPDIGGVATNTLTIANAFISQGYDVTVVTLTSEYWAANSNITVIRNPSLPQLLKLYWQADWILFSNLSAQLCWAAVFMNKKFGLHHHSSSAFNRPKTIGVVSNIKRFIENKIISKSIHFVNSEFTKQDGGNFFEKLPTYITYPIVEYTKVPEHIIGGYPAKKNAIFVGRIEIEKGVSYLLEHIDIIKQSLNIDELTLVGSGSLLNSLQKQKLKGVKFTGAVDLATVHKLMAEAAYVFVPSIWQEPFGMVALEGLAAGAVVISSDRGGLPEAVGDTGVLFDLDSEVSFREALLHSKRKRDNYLNRNLLLKHVDAVNRHMERFSSYKVINIIINAFNDSDNNSTK
jgi:glycogen(starch) synthase